MKTEKYGAWTSPITSDLIVAESIRLSTPVFHKNRLFWLEGRPQEAGRNLVVMLDNDGLQTDLTPAPYNLRSQVHEYGGGTLLLNNDRLYFVNFSDQQIISQSIDGGSPVQLTHSRNLRFADLVMDKPRNRLIAVIEDHNHQEHEPENYLAAIDLDSGETKPLVRGYDFYSNPRVKDNKLIWLCWRHPNMPWDGTELWVADLDEQGEPLNAEKIAGGKTESIFQPEFGVNDCLFYVSDKNGWWNIYRYAKGISECVIERQAEFGLPQWVFNMKTYQVVDDHRLITIYSENNISRLAMVDVDNKILTDIDTDDIDLNFTHLSDLTLSENNHQAAFIAASPTKFNAIYTLDLNSLDCQLIKQASQVNIEPSFYSLPETLVFDTGGNDKAHGFYYPPANPEYQAPAEDKPPLLVKLHGGPTGSTQAVLDLQIQYWTSRGFGVLDVNYRGSTGYGRQYREKLNLQWGVADVEDASFGALHLVNSNRVDGKKLAIRGGSAGGYTVLSALTFTDTFSAGASYYGISDLILLAKDTHKFESRYTDSLVGPYPEQEELYKQRSPVYHVDQLSCPVIFLQGSEDKVVPPNQAETMVEMLKQKGLPVAYVLFEGEQHGFRQAKNIKRALDLELYFYSRVFGFEPADTIEPITIDNM